MSMTSRRNGFRVLACLGATLTATLAVGAGSRTGMVLRTDAARSEITLSIAEPDGETASRVVTWRVANRAELETLAPGVMVDVPPPATASNPVEGLRVRRHAPADTQGMKVEQLALLESLASAEPLVPVRIGEAVPDFTLIDHQRRPVSLSQFSGALVAVSFMYTSCHLPDYCFRLTNNFARLQRRFGNRLGRDLVLLTITFDPIHDQPDVLARYGATWKAAPRGWRLLGGPADDVRRVCRSLGMNAWPEMGMMAHELRTVVIDRRGRLAASIEGNEFTAAQLGDLVASLLVQR